MKQIKTITKEVSITDRSLSLDLYFQEFGKKDLLEKDEFDDMIELYRKTKKEAYKTKIVKANLSFVISLAKMYQHQGLDLDDLIMEGNIGLLVAIDKYDPSLGNTFISFAIHYIRKAITDALNEKSRIVRLPSNRVLEGYKITSNSTDAKVGNDEDKDKTFGDVLSGDMNANGYDREDFNHKAILHLFNALTDREKKIICMLYGIGCREYSMYEVSVKFRLTEERVRQINIECAKKMRNFGL